PVHQAHPRNPGRVLALLLGADRLEVPPVPPPLGAGGPLHGADRERPAAGGGVPQRARAPRVALHARLPARGALLLGAPARRASRGGAGEGAQQRPARGPPPGPGEGGGGGAGRALARDALAGDRRHRLPAPRPARHGARGDELLHRGGAGGLGEHQRGRAGGGGGADHHRGGPGGGDPRGDGVQLLRQPPAALHERAGGLLQRVHRHPGEGGTGLMPRRSRRGAANDLTAEINVTSLVDVAFTLLVIFIITAPIMQAGVEVKVPQARAETITTTDAVIVTVTREGQVYIGE